MILNGENMKNVVIVDSVRTGLAKSHRGGFNMTRPDEMLAHIIDAMLDRNPEMPPEAVEDIIMGCGNPEGAHQACNQFLWPQVKLWLVVMTL